ncbi:hypothetical protein [Spirosoma sp.]|uniref:hypothetical protein n=1 Tax=Spirosoma sp. TaxID=1899569 RepID=UPI002623BAFC|nr:hypothetical protein [Spirosoma sp.]MCX6217143.1 hypothetical protein [Spirosoma sp.]
METSIQTIVKLIRSALLAFAVLIGMMALAFAIFFYAYSIPSTDFDLTNVDKDTTFYVRTQRSNGEGTGRLAMLASGAPNDSTASISTKYANPAVLMGETHLPKGKINQLYQRDFYNSRDKVNYHHMYIIPIYFCNSHCTNTTRLIIYSDI